MFHVRTFAVLSLTVPALLTLGCNTETSDPNSEACTPIPGVEGCGALGTGESGGAGETGSEGTETGSEPEELGIGECQHNDDESVVGWRWQCEGEVFASIQFDGPLGTDCPSILGDGCSEHHVFGPSNDKYEAPDVMACCGDYDSLYKDVYLQYCNYDVVQQVCISMAKRLEKLVKDGSFGSYAGQGAALQTWVAQNYELCFAELLQNNTAATPDALETYWQIPDDTSWSSLDNFVISITTGTESTGVFQPVDPADRLPCHGTIDNNDEIFEGAPAPSGGTAYGVDLMSTTTASLGGPVMWGGSVTGALLFSASCAFKGCSTANFWESSTGAFSFEDIALYSDSFTVSNGNGSSLIADSARLTLYETAAALPVYDSNSNFLGYEVAAGDAFFLFSGTQDNIYDHYVATNANSFVISEFGGTWTVGSFVVEYIDDDSDTWTLSVPATTWD